MWINSFSPIYDDLQLSKSVAMAVCVNGWPLAREKSTAKFHGKLAKTWGRPSVKFHFPVSGVCATRGIPCLEQTEPRISEHKRIRIRDDYFCILRRRTFSLGINFN
jgi:hypothetical protein